MSIQVINPVSSKELYVENDIVDFNMTFENKSFIPGSLRLTGELNVNNGANNLAKNVNCFYDGVAGAHSLFQSITCSTDKQGVIETNAQYPRYVKSKSVARQSYSQLCSNTANATELKISGDNLTAPLLAQSSNANGYDGVGENYTPFSVVLDVCFNKANNNIGFSKSGQMYVSLRLATNRQFLYGSASSGYSYQLQNLQLQYMVSPKDSSAPITMESIYGIRNTIESNNANIRTTVPAVCQSMSCIFHEEATLNTANSNDLELQTLPDVERVQFSFNDSNNTFIAYQLKYLDEILMNYQQSWGFTGNNMINSVKLGNGSTYGIGLPFKQAINLSNQSIAMNIYSNCSPTNRYAVFMLFRAIVSI